MLVSTIIPAWNRVGSLERAVDSLLATGYSDIEVVIVDDGSTDGTWELAQRLARTWSGRVRAHCHPDRAHRGVSASRNLGIERSSGSMIAFLDADDYVYAHRFAAAIPMFDDPVVDGVYTTAEMVFASEDARRTWPDSGRIFGLCENAQNGRLLHLLLQSRIWATSGILLRRSLFDRTGLFSEGFATAEDCHLWWRAAVAGRIVAGDLSQPCSAYVRHDTNSFNANWQARVTMLEALLDFERWAHHSTRDPTIRSMIGDRIIGYALQSYSVAREIRRNDLAWNLGWRLVVAWPWNYRRQCRMIRPLGSLVKSWLMSVGHVSVV